MVVVKALFLLPGLILGTLGQTETPLWLKRAEALQRYIGYDVPLDRLTLTATHNSFATDRNRLTHFNFEVVTAQNYSITNQLTCLGVRGLELDPHYIDELAVEGDEESAIRLCHASADQAVKLIELCNTFGWDVCESIGVYDFGDNTGCRSDSPTLREGFEEIADWLQREENSEEVLYIKLDSSVEGQEELVSDIAASVFEIETILSPQSFDQDSEEWPSPQKLVNDGTRIVLAGLGQSSLVFDTATNGDEEITLAFEFDPSKCSEADGFPDLSWKRVQGNMVEYQLYHGNVSIFSLIPDEDEALTAAMTPRVMQCGLTPIFDRLDAELMNSTVWSWDAERPEATFSQARAAIASAETGRWTDVDSFWDYGERHSYACRNEGNRSDWKVVAVKPTINTNSSSSSSTPDTGGDDGDDDDEEEEEEEESTVVYSSFTGNFDLGGEACSSFSGVASYVFSAPQTAYENEMLRQAIEDAGVETAWLDYTSSGSEKSTCWTREGGEQHCVALASNDTCPGKSTEALDRADGQIPDSVVALWEEDNYIRPSYDATFTVENMHTWIRVSGSNNFDIDDEGYVTGIILAAIPVFVLGLIIGCCCLPVGHIAAGSKEHHVGGRGFFGSLCPTRCKQGDFMGSGTLAVVMLGTILTVIGGGMAIYGVRSVDDDIVGLWKNLNSMAEDMISVQSQGADILTPLEIVQSNFPIVAECAEIQLLEEVSDGIPSSTKAIGELVHNSKIGEVGTSIQNINVEIEKTNGLRRGVVYCTGGFVLLMAIIYLVVGYYALRKDGGQGKGGGARLRGPVMIGCLFLPLTLLVILLCWFLFGLSTSLALLASDFCVDPTEHTVSVFDDPKEKELVLYYISCQNSNVFAEALTTAYVQGKIGQKLLESVDNEAFAQECPQNVSALEAVEVNMVDILDKIDHIRDLVQCSRVNPYFIDGVEGSLCSDAPARIWFVIFGFAVVSVSLFVVAVSFRLLLQQKEEGLYRVVFDDHLAEGLTSIPASEDSFTFRAFGSTDIKNNNDEERGGGGRRGRQYLHDNPPSAVPVVTNTSNAAKRRVPPRGTLSAIVDTSPTDSSTDRSVPSPSSSSSSGCAQREDAAVARTAVAAASAAAACTPTSSSAPYSQPNSGKANPGRSKPVELTRPVPRGSSFRQLGSGGGTRREQQQRHQRGQPGGNVGSLGNPLAATMTGGRGGAGDRNDGRQAATMERPSSLRPASSNMSMGRTTGRSSSRGSRARTGEGQRGSIGVVTVSSSDDDDRSVDGGSSVIRWFGHAESRRRQAGSGCAVVGRDSGSVGGGGSATNDTRQSARLSSKTLFRTLAGLDDPHEETPSVIVSRYDSQSSGTRDPNSIHRHSSERFAFTVARPSSFAGSRSHLDSTPGSHHLQPHRSAPGRSVAVHGPAARKTPHASGGGGKGRHVTGNGGDNGDDDDASGDHKDPSTNGGSFAVTTSSQPNRGRSFSRTLSGHRTRGAVDPGRGREISRGQNTAGGNIGDGNIPRERSLSGHSSGGRAWHNHHHDHILSPTSGTWAAFAKKSRKEPSVITQDQSDFTGNSSNSDGHRSSADGPRSSRRGRSVASSGGEGGRVRSGAREEPSHKGASSPGKMPPATAVTGWWQQRSHLQTASRASSHRTASNTAAVTGLNGNPRRSTNAAQIPLAGRSNHRAAGAAVPGEATRRTSRDRPTGGVGATETLTRARDQTGNLARTVVVTGTSRRQDLPQPGAPTGIRDLSALARPTPAERYIPQAGGSTARNNGGGGRGS